MIVYFDTTALVKLYADEPGAVEVRSVSKKATGRFISFVAFAEIRSAFARKRRFGQLIAGELEPHKFAFERDWPSFEPLPVDEPRSRRAGESAETYALKGFDAIHLASAEYFHRMLGPTTFACFDAALARAAPAAWRCSRLPERCLSVSSASALHREFFHFESREAL